MFYLWLYYMYKKERFYLGLMSDMYIFFIVYIVFKSIDFSVIIIFFILSFIYYLVLLLIKNIKTSSTNEKILQYISFVIISFIKFFILFLSLVSVQFLNSACRLSEACETQYFKYIGIIQFMMQILIQILIAVKMIQQTQVIDVQLLLLKLFGE